MMIMIMILILILILILIIIIILLLFKEGLRNMVIPLIMYSFSLNNEMFLIVERAKID